MRERAQRSLRLRQEKMGISNSGGSVSSEGDGNAWRGDEVVGRAAFALTSSRCMPKGLRWPHCDGNGPSSKEQQDVATQAGGVWAEEMKMG